MVNVTFSEEDQAKIIDFDAEVSSTRRQLKNVYCRSEGPVWLNWELGHWPRDFIKTIPEHPQNVEKRYGKVR